MLEEICISTRNYLQTFQKERLNSALLRAQLRSGEDVTSRKNFRGHCTASMIILDEDHRILLIQHLATGKLLQPGGHLEPKTDASLWRAAAREVLEETGIEIAGLHPWHDARAPMPLDIDSHFIPARPEKNEPEHWHHDFCYLALAPSGACLSAQAEEISGVGWHRIGDPSVPGRILRALARTNLISSRPAA